MLTGALLSLTGGTLQASYIYNGSFATSGVDPFHLAVGTSGALYVPTGYGFNEYSAGGALLSSYYGGPGKGNGQFNQFFGTGAIALDSSGDVFVTDYYAGRVEEFSSSLTFVRNIGSPGTGAGQLGEIGGIAADAFGNLWISDETDGRIEEFSNTGTYLGMIADAGAGLGLAFDSGGDLFATNGSQVEEFFGGALVRSFGSFGDATGVAVAPDGNILVSDNLEDTVSEFTPTGTLLDSFGGYGSAPGLFNNDVGLAFNQAGALFVADAYNSRIQIFTDSVPSPTPEPATALLLTPFLLLLALRRRLTPPA